MLWFAGEFGAQCRVLRGDADGTGVQMALAHHDATGGDQRRCGKAELVGAEQRAHDHVATGAQAAVDLHSDAAAQAIEHKRLVGFGQADFPRGTSVLDGGQGRCARAAFKAGDRDVIGARLGNAGGDRADADFGHEFDRDVGARIDVFQVEDELRQILDGINVVMGRWRDQADARRRMPHARNRGVDLVTWQLPAFSGLGTLRHLDLHHVRIDQVFSGDAEPPGRHLLDRRAHAVAVGHRLKAVGFLAALASVGFAADAVHRDGERRVRFAADRAKAHRAGCKALDEILRGLDFGEGNRFAPHRLGQADAEHAAQRHQLFGLFVAGGREIAELLRNLAAHRIGVVGGAHGVLQVGNGVWPPHMGLAADAVGVFTADFEIVVQHGHVTESGAVALDGFARDFA